MNMFAGASNPFLQSQLNPLQAQQQQSTFGFGQNAAAGFSGFQTAAPAFGAPAANPAFGQAQQAAMSPQWLAEMGAERFTVGKGLRGSISSVSWFPGSTGQPQAFLACGTWDGDLHAITVYLTIQQTPNAMDHVGTWPYTYAEA
jgi:hypothetical protein